MGWSFEIPATRLDEFANAVDAQVNQWRKAEKPDRHMVQQVDAGTRAAKAVARSNALNSEYLAAFVSGNDTSLVVRMTTPRAPVSAAQGKTRPPEA